MLISRSRRPRSAAALTLVILLSAFARAGEPPPEIAPFFTQPPAYRDDFGSYKSPLVFDDGRPVRTEAEWKDRRKEILAGWHRAMGAWPPRIERPKVEELDSTRREDFLQRKVRLEVAPDRSTEGYFLMPDGPGPFPAILVVFYEPETAIGRGRPNLDFAYQMARRGCAALSIGFDPRVIDTDESGFALQPLSYLAYVASNAYNALAAVPSVDPGRIGVVGHSYGGKWAMFAACLDDRFSCGAWSDPGIAFDETRPNVNYWDPWYLGWEPGRTRKAGLPSAANPRTGAYKRLTEEGRDLHELQALMAPRPFFVSGGSEDPPSRWKALNHALAVNRMLGQDHRVAMSNRPDHPPTVESNLQMYRFLEYALKLPSR